MRGSKGNSTSEATRSPYAAEAGTLGVLLCWAIVFADVGTSVYYTPGILFRQVGTHTGLFVDIVFVVFVLLCIKYAEVAIRFPEGGGVVTVATKAIHPIAGLVGGLFILVDYFLTAGLSATSGVIYLSVIIPGLTPLILVASVAALLILGALNVMGIRSSANVTAFFAIAAAVGQLAVVIAVILAFGPGRLVADFGQMFAGPPLTPLRVLTGYAGAFLAFSGLESISQLAPAMKSPRKQVAHRTMVYVILTMLITSPLLSLWSTTLLKPGVDSNQGVSLLGGLAAGPWLQNGVAITGALLLIFACNTALIGCYHVFLALSRMHFLPAVLQATNRWRGTPHVSIAIATLIPVLVVFVTRASTSVLGDLYAFGLLGAFSVTCISLDIIRWHGMQLKHAPRDIGRTSGPMFVLGVVTTFAVVLAWFINLFNKPLATAYGGGVVIIGLALAYLTIRRETRQGRYAIFPHLHRPGHPMVMLRRGQRLPSAAVLALLPDDPTKADEVIERALSCAGEGRIVFAFEGQARQAREPALLEILDPYADDEAAQAVFQRAEAAVRKARRRAQYVYIPGGAEAGVEDWLQEHLKPEQVVRA